MTLLTWWHVLCWMRMGYAMAENQRVIMVPTRGVFYALSQTIVFDYS